MRPLRPPQSPRPRVLALALAAALAAGAVMAESGTVLRATELRSEPQASAEVVAKLAAQQSVEITARQGMPAYEVSNHARPGAESRCTRHTHRAETATATAAHFYFWALSGFFG